MFQDYSKRALQIVFEARFKAGQRGSDAVDVGDLLFAFVMEDQDRFRELILQQHPEAAVYFEPESPPPSSRQMWRRTCWSVLRVSFLARFLSQQAWTCQSLLTFESYLSMRRLFAMKRITAKFEPLHLFAGVLHAGSGIVIDELQKAGITYDSVMSKLRKGTNEE